MVLVLGWRFYLVSNLSEEHIFHHVLNDHKSQLATTERRDDKHEHSKAIFKLSRLTERRYSIDVMDSKTIELLTKDFRGRVYWLISAITCAVFMFFVGAVAAHVIYRSLSGYPSAYRRGVCGLTGLICLCSVVILQLFGNTLQPHAVQHLVEMLELASGTTSLHSAGNFLSGLSIAVAIAVMVACSLTVNLPPVGLIENRESLTVKSNRLQLLLYTCAALLVIGVFEVHALLGWLSAFTVEDNLGAHIKAVTSGIANAIGVFFSLLLVSVYLPAAAILQIRKHALGREGQSKRDASIHWSQREGLYGSPLQMFTRGAAILAPILVGLFGKLLLN